MKRTVGSIVALVAGVLLLAPAAGLAIGGGTLLAVDAARDRTGYVSSPALHLSSTTAAITAENLTITGNGQWVRDVAGVGGLRVAATSPAGTPVFVGIAPQQAVDAWLAGVAHDRLTSVQSRTARYNRDPGAVGPAASPSAQQFWLASATGAGSAQLQWNVVDGQFAVVVTNADGSPGIAADVRAAAQVPRLAGFAGGLLTAGILLGILAVGLIALGGVGLGRRHSGPPPAAGPPSGPPPSGPAPADLAQPSAPAPAGS